MYSSCRIFCNASEVNELHIFEGMKDVPNCGALNIEKGREVSREELETKIIQGEVYLCRGCFARELLEHWQLLDFLEERGLVFDEPRIEEDYPGSPSLFWRRAAEEVGDEQDNNA